MRLALAACIAFATFGCANTIQRLDGEIPLATGPARNACEKKDWLVMAPTSYEVVLSKAKTSETHSDGAALYDVGGRDPKDLPELGPRLDNDPILERKAEEVAPHDRDRTIAMVLGGLGVAAVGTGTTLFITGFGEKTNAQGEPETDNDTTQIVAGAITAGAGFIIGIVGLAVNPDSAERAEADASRYVFNPSKDDPRRVKALIERHNARVRQRCDSGAGVPEAPVDAPVQKPTTEEAAPWLQGEGAPPAAAPSGDAPAPDTGE
ncbi:MAG: hypothetical protein H6718_16305 [Polyangiaceae bacterium]|nr:hypothetical protein [Polyangiaceae bacterium]MCB9608252.1 hypothetical protein [Polyangiaceae bacterium]